MIDSRASKRRILEPQERIAEVLFGLIMVVTFTGSLSVADAGRDDVRTMIIGAFGCNLAWGIIDGVFFLMGGFAERGRKLLLLRAVRSAPSAAEARRLIAAALPPIIASISEGEELSRLHARLLTLPEPPAAVRLTVDDARGALGVFLLVFASTFPVALPFVFLHHVPSAMRISNAIALVMLLVTGIAYGRAVGRSQWAFGIGMVALGAVLIALTIALGG